MPALIKFTVDDETYAKVCYDIADANKYINLISKSLLEDNNLKSLLPLDPNHYKLETTSITMDITTQLITDDQLAYILNHSKNGHHLKSYRSKSIEQLVLLAHKELHRHSSDPTEYEDVTGQWNTDNDDNELNTYTLYIAIGPARIRYTDVLASLDFDKNPLTKPVLGEDTDDYKLKKVTSPTSSMIVAFFESFLLAFIGGIICLIGTSSYIKTIAKNYSAEYQVKDHLRKTLTNNMLGLAIGFVVNLLFFMSTIGQNQQQGSSFVINWPWLIIFVVVCAIAYPAPSSKINRIDE